jgi:hypothetical protein
MAPFSPYLLAPLLALIGFGFAFWDYRRVCKRWDGRR